MKPLLLLLMLVVLSNDRLHSQEIKKRLFYCSYGEGDDDIEQCKLQQQNFFTGNDQAEKAVDRILKPLGLSGNFVLLPCPYIKNAAAVISEDGIRYIVYENKFMERINNVAKTDWASTSILAHVIGHHLCGHTLRGSADPAEQQQKELEADEFSGYMLFKLGASLSQATKAVNLVVSDDNDSNSDHPNRSKRLTAVEAGYNKAKKKQPIANVDNSPSAEKFINDGNRLRKQKRFQDAIDQYTRAIELKPAFGDAYIWRGLSRHDAEDYQGAIADYNKVLELDPNNAIAFFDRGNAKYALIDYPGALADYNKAISLDSSDAVYFNNRGNAKYYLKDYKGAIADYYKSIVVDPDYVLAYNNRGYSKDVFKDYEGALADYNRSIALDPNYALGYFNRGLTKDALKDFSGAIADYTKYIQLSPSAPEGYYERGLTKQKTNNWAGACEDFKKGCRLGDIHSCNKLRNDCQDKQ